MYQEHYLYTLNEEQKFLFKATVLVESSGGVKELNDIAYIYLNLINDFEFEEGMKKSSAYLQRNIPKERFMFWVYMYLITGDKKYKYIKGENKDYTKTYQKTVEMFIDEYEYDNHTRTEQIRQHCEFIDKYIFCENPETKYLGWYGQGNISNDMNLGVKKKDIAWEKARQYYWLQKECKVKERLLVELKAMNLDNINSTTCIFDREKILKYFEENPTQFSHPVKQIPYDRNKL